MSDYLSYSEVRRYVRSVSYKPGWLFHVVPDVQDLHRCPPGVTPRLVLRASHRPPCAVEYAANGGDSTRHVPIASVSMMTWPHSLEILELGIRTLVRNMEEHESAEWLRVDGKLLDDQHDEEERAEFALERRIRCVPT